MSAEPQGSLSEPTKENARLAGAARTNVAARQRAEEALAQSELRFRALYQHAPIGIGLAKDGLSLMLNPALVRMFGFDSEAEVIGTTFLSHIAPEYHRMIVQEHVERVARNDSSFAEYEAEGVRKDGSQFPFLIRGMQLDLGDGPVDVGYFFDIAERRRVQEELRFRTSLLQAQSEASIDGILVVSPERRMISWNRRFIEIWRLAPEMLEAGDSDAAANSVTHQVADPEPMRALTYYLYEHPDETGHDLIPLKDGRTIDRYSAPIRGADGANYGRIWFYRDITAEVEMQEALRRAVAEAEAANRAKSEFLSRMSHELRTPLNAIIGFADLMEMDPDTSPRQRERGAHILTAGRHLLGLINEVLEISRIEAGGLSLSPEPVAVDELLAEAMELVRPQATQAGVHLTMAPVAAGLHLKADRQRLKQVLLNLLSNAVKYNHRGGNIELRCGPADGERLRISVTDTGIGIAAEEMHRLFTPFDRLGAEQSGVEGTGLGLAIAQRLVAAMGGELSVESAPRAGSTFSVDLPAASAPLVRHTERGEDALISATATATQSATVLYIEDNRSNVELVEHVLAFRPGVELLSATDAAAGLALARERRPQMILLDLNLPDLHGRTVLQRLRELPETQAIPVVVVSADATEHQVERLLADGARAYLTKPLDVRRLLEVLDSTLAEGGSA